MINHCFKIINAHIITPSKILHNASLTVKNGIICDIGSQNDTNDSFPIVDAQERYLFPGFIDMHSDAIEREIEPRPGSLLPIEIAVSELDRKLAASGITTIYHSLSFNEKKLEVVRTTDMVDTVIREICRLKKHLLINTKIHARFEITSTETLAILKKLIDDGSIDLVSIMDHTLGQGQFTTIEQFRDYYGPRFFDDQDKITKAMDNLKSICSSVRLSNSEAAARLCKEKGIPLASHDDDTTEKISFIHSCGAVISEFPITLAAGEAARKNGLDIAVGSPNIVRGGSHNGNLSASELVRLGLGTIVCSDYIPSTMLHAAISLYKNYIVDLVGIGALFSTNAAKALGLDHLTGSIKEGLAADFILVDTNLKYPRISKTFVQGREVYSACLK